MKYTKSIQTIIFGLFALIFLAWPNYYLLKTVEGLNLFLPTGMFFKDCMAMPGGFLTWIGTYLTQFFYHPWLGGFFYAVVLAAIMVVAYKALRLPKWGYGIAAVAPAMLLLSFLSLGYMVFSFKTPGMAFVTSLGCLASIAIYWGCRLVPQAWVRAVIVVAVILVGYPLLGFYSLFAAALISLGELSRMIWNREEGKCWLWGLLPLALALAGIVVFPPIYHRYAWTLLSRPEMYIAALPAYYPNEQMQWMPYAVAYGLMAIAALLNPLWTDSKGGKAGAIASWGVLAASICAVCLLRYTDSNYAMTLSMRRAVYDGDWQKAISMADKNQEFEPTRLNVLLTDIALLRDGSAPDRMFAYRAGAAPYNTTRVNTAMRDACSQIVSFHFGRVNNAYRWAMEYSVEYGFTIDYLQTLVKCALLNEEYDLARKYLQTLSQTKYHKDWAAKYMSMADDPSLIEQDPELSQIKPLMVFRDHLGGDGGKIEPHLLPAVSGLMGGPDELLNLSLLTNLMQRNVDGFMVRFGNTLSKFPTIPKHYQEAVMIWADMHDNPVHKRMPIDPAIAQRYSQLRKDMEQVGSMGGEAAVLEMIKNNYSDTYWCYFYATGEMRKNIF